MFVSLYDSPVGRLLITADDHALRGIVMAEADAGAENPNALTALAAKQLTEYFAGVRQVFSLPLAFSGTPFQEDVWRALAKIPYGQTVSYGELAKACGHPAAVRAAANAVGKNPFLIVLPCHRVLASRGRLGGFSAGISIKKALLSHENILWREP